METGWAENDSPNNVLRSWGLEAERVDPVEAGHINRTYRIETGKETFALQWVNPIFDPAIHFDIQVVTATLARAGLATPRLIPAGGRLWVEAQDGGVWRLMTWIEGEMLLRADGPARCREAGRLLGRFHRALWNLEHDFCGARPGVHDTARHLAALEEATRSHRGHRLYDRIAPVADAILEAARDLAPLAGLPGRVVHGDPKISNVIFAPDGRAVCLIDLDTLARMPLAVELGDAFRSWCHPRGEDEEGLFVLSRFEAGLGGWAGAVGDRLTPDERAAVVPAVETVALELAARFCRDAFEESYFGWDRGRFASAAEHNLQRARAQLGLARSIRAQRADLERIRNRLLSGS